MSVASQLFEANQFPLPFTSFSVVSAEWGDALAAVNETNTERLRRDLRLNQVAFIEARGMYNGKHEVCFVLLGDSHQSMAEICANNFGQVSYLSVYDGCATECFTDGSTKLLPNWRIVNPDIDPCLAIPGMPAIQFYSK